MKVVFICLLFVFQIYKFSHFFSKKMRFQLRINVLFSLYLNFVVKMLHYSYEFENSYRRTLHLYEMK